MNARILRRSLFSAGMAVIIGASVYAAAGVSSAASHPPAPRVHPAAARGTVSRPQASPARAVRTLPVTITVENKAGKTISHRTGVAKLIRLGSGAPPPGIAGPAGVKGPSTYCYAYYSVNYSIGAGGSVIETITFSSGPFIAGYGFNETTKAIYAETTEYQSGDTVQVTALNNGTSTETMAGYMAVLYTGGGC
jgi:hypothetical protein